MIATNAAARVSALTASAEQARLKGDLADAALRAEAALRLAEVEGLGLGAEPHLELARILQQMKRLDEAETWLRSGLDRAGDDARLHTRLGQILRAVGRGDEALAAFDKALALDPSNPLPWVQRGLILIDRREAAAAVAVFEEVVRLAPDVGEHHRLLAVALRLDRQFERAGREFETALELAPQEAAAWVDLAMFREETQRPAEALALLERGIAAVGLHRRLVEARAAALRRRGRHGDVVTWLDALLQENEAVYWLHFQLAVTLQGADRRRANVHFMRANALDPSDARIATACAESLDRTGGPQEAQAIAGSYELALRRLDMGGDLRPDRRVLARILIRNGDFDAFARLGSFEDLGAHWVATGADAALSLLFSQVKTPGHRRLLVEWHRARGRRLDEVARRSPLAPPSSPVRAPAIGGRAKIRVGLMAADLCGSANAPFVRPLIAHRDRSRFEFFGYSWAAGAPQGEPAQTAGRFDAFRHAVSIGDRAAAQVVAEDRLDVLFDLGGPSEANPAVAGWRPAPRQASWLGTPHSSGLGAIDRMVVDRHLVPTDPALMIEKPLLLPRSSLAFERAGDAPSIDPQTPEERNGFVTFGTMGHPLAYNPEVIATWAEILKRLPWARFVFVRPESAAESFRKQIEARFEAHGVKRNRISHVPGRGAHLKHYDRIDVALDTFPRTGRTTTCEALSMGVPVVALAGEALFERLSNSVLHNAGLGELVTSTREAYVAKAVDVARATAWRGELRRGLTERLASHPLGDGPGFARDFEAAVTAWMDEPR